MSLGAPPGGGLVVGNAGSYGLWLLNESGEVVSRGGRDLPLPRKSDAEVEDERRIWAERGQAEREIDPYRPHIANDGVQVDGEGRIWVLTGRYGDNDSVFDVFDAGGNHPSEVVIGAVVRRTATGIHRFTARGDLLAVATQQPDGNDQVWVYRISGS